MRWTGAYEANRQVQKVVSLLQQVVMIPKQTLAQGNQYRLASQQMPG